MDYEAAVRAGEALVVGYLLIACALGACPPTHFGKGQLQPACDGLGNVLQLMESADRGKDRVQRHGFECLESFIATVANRWLRNSSMG